MIAGKSAALNELSNAMLEERWCSMVMLGWLIRRLLNVCFVMSVYCSVSRLMCCMY